MSDNNILSLIRLTYDCFADKVWYDPESRFSGAVFPAGTKWAPVNNLPDAARICNYRGFNQIVNMADEPLFTDEEITELLNNIFPQNTGLEAQPKVECECGADKCGSPRHSDWCPKHKEE